MLTTWLLNTSSARQLGLETTGHASRGLAGPPGVSPSNLTLQPGELDQAAPDARGGIRPAGHLDVRPVAERQHRRLVGGLLGFWFEDGEIAYPVTEITVAGNLIDIYARLVPGSDWRSAARPTRRRSWSTAWRSPANERQRTWRLPCPTDSCCTWSSAAN